MYGNVEKTSKTIQTFAHYSLLCINIGMSDATEEIWKTPPAREGHELKISEFGGKDTSSYLSN